MLHRAHLHQSLKDAVLSEEGPGTPVELHLACRIFALDTDKATLALEDGRQFSGDLIVGADGVHVSLETAQIEALIIFFPGLTVELVVDTIPHRRNDQALSLWLQLLPMAGAQRRSGQVRGYARTQ